MSYPGSEFDQVAEGLLVPADYVNPAPRSAYHLVIIGAGPAGLIAAIGAAGVGASVALIEADRMGGDCLNVGCVPSKALLSHLDAAETADFDAAFAFARQIRSEIAPHDSVARYTELGVDVFLGEAQFKSANSVAVGETTLHGRRFLIATGARPVLPPIPGLTAAEPLTNESLFDLTVQPQRLGILGAGVIGCEMAQVFAQLGTEVHLFEMANEVLPLEDPEAGAAVRRSLADKGVNMHLGCAVEEIVPEGELHSVRTADAQVAVDKILVALGRRPNTDALQLDQAGVQVDGQGFVVTDTRLRASNKRVYAAGDCASRAQFTHNADAQARVVVQNALFLPTATIEAHVVPHSVYTTPEVGAVGQSESQLRAAGVDFDVYKVAFSELDRGRVQGDQTGFAKVFTAKGSDRILGACIVGKDAGEQLAGICLLMSNQLGLGAAGKAILSYPTRSEILKRLADAYNRTRMTPLVARIFAFWLSCTDPSKHGERQK